VREEIHHDALYFTSYDPERQICRKSKERALLIARVVKDEVISVEEE
jgi:hypothetical protein